ncbi:MULTISPECIES: putative bifunctional diguanylate cyclase/phosphodiesterase [unclassified Colwellia]|uniref:putative bifunctional diguanylate cyclase/phosphodiesterase n=1 Tax=unclassified Colwellia TaxID=196834 RepID=UPI0015F36F6D|nr:MULTISPECIES: bifunctional diguanylate cyclase/phosphodiesterase [unclassified Colwellia]MBA6232733.1 EAL domain-containing protein [Colwellia sp. MB02u-7]MBA6236179.1 EAL domain-containing protein [Colwellia sp. MB02u-11]MBA6256569.1 EAL domain-containing protein [Colwellia sp. MB3u-28]MBA6261284.1 EAL domain-containing protein [Colwellia sp. MB3u-41]MBA6298421.1 EAL domain-containing protein [Colwellia sp. MB3u-22]
MNRLLKRLIKRHLHEYDDHKSIKDFISGIDDIFAQQQDEREFMERTLTLSSIELNEINVSLKENLAKNENIQRHSEKLIAKQDALFNASTEAIFSFSPDNIIEKLNQAAIDFLDLDVDRLNNGEVLTCDLFLARLVNHDSFSNDIQPIRDNELAVVHGFFETIDHRSYEFYSVPEVVDGDFFGRVWCCRDITDVRKNEALLKYRANHDALTDLPNRSLILDVLNHAIAMGQRHNLKVGLLFIDLDDFKKINDTAGHQEGDRYLIEFANRIKSALKTGDILGRLGGDEFVVILEDINNISHVVQINERILALCKVPFYIKDKKYYMSCSIGVSLSPDDSVSSEELIRKADMAMYQAKESGKNTYHFFDKKLEKIALNSVMIDGQLREAIKEENFVLHYQPKMCLKDNSLCGVEALIRWQKTPNELVYPDCFIHIAEKNGLIRDITHWLLNQACQTLKSWENTALANIPMSLNISAIDFADPLFVEQVFQFIDQYKINPALIELELTESTFFNDIKSVQEKIDKLKSKKIKLAIDDFGTGFSSFAYLRDMELDFLKIDKSFVLGMHKDEKSKAIVKSIIDVGINLGFKVVAEGIESESIMALLTKQGCHIGQGYHMSKPVTEEMLFQFSVKMLP